MYTVQIDLDAERVILKPEGVEVETDVTFESGAPEYERLLDAIDDIWHFAQNDDDDD